MKRIINQIRNIEKIEKELKNNYAGILALQLGDSYIKIKIFFYFLFMTRNYTMTFNLIQLYRLQS